MRDPDRGRRRHSLRSTMFRSALPQRAADGLAERWQRGAGSGSPQPVALLASRAERPGRRDPTTPASGPARSATAYSFSSVSMPAAGADSRVLPGFLARSACFRPAHFERALSGAVGHANEWSSDATIVGDARVPAARRRRRFSCAPSSRSALPHRLPSAIPTAAPEVNLDELLRAGLRDLALRTRAAADSLSVARERRRSTASAVADAEHLVAAHAAGRLHVGGVAFGLADQRAGDRRIDRDLARLDVGLVVADDLVRRARRRSRGPRSRPSRRTRRGRRRRSPAGSMTCACASFDSTSEIRPSMKPCRSFAAS